MVFTVFALVLSVTRKKYMLKVQETVSLLKARPLLVLSEESTAWVLLVYQNFVIPKNAEKSSGVETAL